MTGGASVRVAFSPSGRQGRIPAGVTVLEAARRLGVDIDSLCGGRARCGRCQVRVEAGRFTGAGTVSDAARLSPPGVTERICREEGRLQPGHRLACQAHLLSDAQIDVPASSQVHRQLVRKSFEARPVVIDPLIRLYFLEVPKPVTGAAGGDLERLLQAAREQWNLGALALAPGLLPELPRVVRAVAGQVTIAVREPGTIIGLWPGLHERVLGAAIDVGSTTLAVYLTDLRSGEVLAATGAMNPQIRFGEDVMSRVSWAMLNPGGAAQMTGAVRGALDGLIREAVEAAGVGTVDVMELALVGNPVMHHLALGIDPAPLGTAPFSLATDQAVESPAAALGLSVHSQASAYFLPCIAGHVGADAAAMLLAEAPWEREELNLLVDIGTNAEIVFGNRDRLLAASSPTGPAFEGAQIHCGQRAAPGAIERVRIDPTTLEPRFRLIGCACWSDEPGFAAGARAQPVTGICGSGIVEAIAELFLAGVLRRDGSFDAAAARNPRLRQTGPSWSYLLHQPGIADDCAVVITQADVRAVQLAKAALYAGTQVLMEHFGAGHVDRIRLAGAFGSLIDARRAMVLGMLPDCDLDRVSGAGNAAGTGARMALLSRSARREIERRVRRIEKIETAVAAGFERHFVAAMHLPHATHAFPRLRRVMALPDDGVMRQAGGRRRPRSPRGHRA